MVAPSLSAVRKLHLPASVIVILTAALLQVLAAATPAEAQQAVYAPGEPIVTGFSGVLPPTSASSGDPLDHSFINLDGSSMVIEQVQPDGPPTGQLTPSAPVFAARARDVGQVFGIALDNAPETSGAAAPNIYLSATSAFGLDIVVPGSDGNPVRSRLGAAGATFMPGQWGAAGGATGTPGSIWKVDGTTGEISLFTTIAANAGPGLGDIVFDPSTEQFFVSDLDTGLIYRLALDGTIMDTYDHGVTGRPTRGLAAVADDGSTMDITSPSFNSEDPRTWGFTQAERRVYGLAVHAGRLYYAVAAGPQIWSVAINADGSFGAPRWELDVTGLPSNNEITSIVFDPEGRMILAQRGPQVGSYDYSTFAEPQTSSVVRYTHEFPDDPATPSSWVETPDTYAIGFRPDGANASGGIALGYGYDPETQQLGGTCSAYLWSTGDSLRDNADLAGKLGEPAQVHGLQGNDRTLVRPENDPPFQSYFTDYDGNVGDDQAPLQGHVGAVAIWQDCQGGPGYAYTPPPYVPPPGYIPPPDVNLTLSKWARPAYCRDSGNDFYCGFTIRVRNTGSVPYWGPVTVNDWLPGNPPGAQMSFFVQPPWACSQTGSTQYQCTIGPQLLYPGDAIDLHVVVKLPKKGNETLCRLDNAAEINWSFWHDDNPGDDFDAAAAFVRQGHCLTPPDPRKTDLQLRKIARPVCRDGGSDWLCDFAVIVTNLGPGNFSGPIKVKDTLGTAVTATTLSPLWTCAQAGTVLTCGLNSPVTNKPPGWSTSFIIEAHVKKATDGPPLCRLRNDAVISVPPGGPADPLNFAAGNDSDGAIAKVPDRRCDQALKTDLTITKRLVGCDGPITYRDHQGYACRWVIDVRNAGPGVYHGPLSIEDQSPLAIVNTLQSNPACTGSPTDVVCTAPGSVTLNPGVPVTLPLVTLYPASRQVCRVQNTARILQAPPGSPSNPVGPDVVTAGAALPNPACNSVAPPRPPLPPPVVQCPLNKVMPGGGCCDDGLVWNGRQCVPPRSTRPPVNVVPLCPIDSHRDSRGNCVCNPGTHGAPGSCRPNNVNPGPLCPKDSHVQGGTCVCDAGTHGRPGQCLPNIKVAPIPQCPADSHWNADRRTCQCNIGTQGVPGRCYVPPSKGNTGKGGGITLKPLPGLVPPKNATPICPRDSHWNARARTCECNAPLVGRPGACVAPERPRLKINPNILQFNGGAQTQIR